MHNYPYPYFTCTVTFKNGTSKTIGFGYKGPRLFIGDEYGQYLVDSVGLDGDGLSNIAKIIAIPEIVSKIAVAFNRQEIDYKRAVSKVAIAFGREVFDELTAAYQPEPIWQMLGYLIIAAGAGVYHPYTEPVSGFTMRWRTGAVLETTPAVLDLAYTYDNDIFLPATSVFVPNFPVKSKKRKQLSKRLRDTPYPRIGNQIQQGFDSFNYEKFTWYDLLILNRSSNTDNVIDDFSAVRALNENVIVLAYSSAADVLPEPNDYYTTTIYNEAHKNNWIVVDAVTGNELNVYITNDGKKTFALNMTSELNEWLPKFLIPNIITDGYDGIHYDWAATDVYYTYRAINGNSTVVDIDGDGVIDDITSLDEKWQAGQIKLFQNTRDFAPSEFLITGNAGFVQGVGAVPDRGELYSPYLNGVQMEYFMTNDALAVTTWSDIMYNYYNYDRYSIGNKVSFCLTAGAETNYALMRFGLCSTLMFDIGFYVYTNTADVGSGAYASFWWYDEFSVDFETGMATNDRSKKHYLGWPIGRAFNAADSIDYLDDRLVLRDNSADDYVWRRNFTNGIVLVNPSSDSKTVALGAVYRKIIGVVDPTFNNGSEGSSIILPSKTGIILLNGV